MERVEEERINQFNKTVEAFILQDKYKTDEVIIVGKLFSDKALDYLNENCFNGSSIHLFDRENIGKGACLRAIEIQQSFGSGIEIEQDVQESVKDVKN